MENENGEPLIKEKEQPVKKAAGKDKRGSILKQLDSKKLYPVQERVGIYAIAVLSTIGLVLIGYTGVMAIASNTANIDDAPVVDAEEVHDMLDEIDLEDLTEYEAETDDFEPNHEYVETDEETDEEIETEPMLETEPNEETEPEPEAAPAPTSATINAPMIGLRREPGSPDIMRNLFEGDVVGVLDFDSNPYWVRVSYEAYVGYVAREFVDPN